jgi:hypothetical protein
MTIERAVHGYLETQAQQENEMCVTNVRAWLKSGRTDCRAPARPQPDSVDEAILAIDEALTEC